MGVYGCVSIVFWSVLLVMLSLSSNRPHLLTVLTRDGSIPSVGVVDTPTPEVTRSLLLQLCPDNVVSPEELPWKRCTHSHEVVDYPSVLLVCWEGRRCVWGRGGGVFGEGEEVCLGKGRRRVWGREEVCLGKGRRCVWGRGAGVFGEGEEVCLGKGGDVFGEGEDVCLGRGGGVFGEGKEVCLGKGRRFVWGGEEVCLGKGRRCVWGRGGGAIVMIPVNSFHQSSRFCVVVDDEIMGGFEFTDVMMSVSPLPSLYYTLTTPWLHPHHSLATPSPLLGYTLTTP